MLAILTEKPSAAKNFAKALGGMSGTFQGQDYVICNARGHLYELQKPEQQVDTSKVFRYKSWDFKDLPWDEKDFAWIRTRKTGANVAGMLQDIKQKCRDADELVLACDADPTGEGQLIGWEIFSELGVAKRKKISRMYHVDESVQEIQKAFLNRVTLPDMENDPEYKKAEFRTRFDFLTMQFTRVATGLADGRPILRQGRLKSAMVLLVGDALAKLKAYKKIPSYQNRFRDENGVLYIDENEPKFKSKDQVPQTYHASAVVHDGTTRKKTAPPKLVDLAALSSMLAPMGITSKQVLDTYQKMYEHQVLSYPRTEDKHITPEQFNELFPKIDAIARVIGVDPAILTHRQPRKTHVKVGGAHGANRPGPVVPKSLDQLEQEFGFGAGRIYEIVARSYLAMLCEDYEYDTETGHVKDYPSFKGYCSVPRVQGWRVVYNTGDTADDENALGLGKTAAPFIFEGYPPKPPTPTMKWLMKQLEGRNVGTGATRVSIYADVTDGTHKYPLLVDTKGKLTMTPFGEQSYDLLPGTHIGDLALTEWLYEKMDGVAKGSVDPEECLAQVATWVVDDIAAMTANKKKKGGSVMSNTGGTTGGQSFPEKEKATGTWNGVEVRFNRVWGGHRFTDEEVNALLRGETIGLHGLISKSGSTYGVTGKLSRQTYNGHEFVGFEKLDFIPSEDLPRSWCQHVFTDSERGLLEAGEEVYIEGFKSQKGSTFACKVRWGEKDGRKQIIPNYNYA